MVSAALDASVVICCYTEARWDDLVAAVASVQHQTAAPREIIVVVDHNPSLLERVRARLSGVLVLENRQTRGLSGARNSGVGAARGAVVAFLDDDAEAAPDWLARLLDAYVHRDVLGVGGAIEPIWLAGRPAWFPEEFNWVVGCSYRGLPPDAAPVRNLIGANMSVRRELFEIVGGFEVGLGHVGTRLGGDEETELCIRARQRWPEAVFLYQPAARVRHRVPVARGSWSYYRARCYAEGLAKARLSRLVGAVDGLASERSYTFRTLPLGVVRGLGDALFRRDPAGVARAGAITAGLAITTAGYLAGTVMPRSIDHHEAIVAADGAIDGGRVVGSGRPVPVGPLTPGPVNVTGPAGRESVAVKP